MDGVIRTRVGYAGGKKKAPSYHDLGDHTETIQIDYDPTRISYDKLLNVFWNSHSPTTRCLVRQYKSAVFFHDEEQKRQVTASRHRTAARLKKEIHTEIIPFTGFTLAEAYHQKYQLRLRSDFMSEFKAMYPETEDFVNSTAAARVNGYLGGYGTLAQLQRELDSLGLSTAARDKLLQTMNRTIK
jgi:peptide-methionine (S)-S-oxide reductase